LQPAYGSDELWKTEKRNLERRQIYVAELRKAEELRKSGKYEDAEFILRCLIENDPPDSRAAAMLKVTDLDRASARTAANASRIVWPKTAPLRIADRRLLPERIKKSPIPGLSRVAFPPLFGKFRNPVCDAHVRRAAWFRQKGALLRPLRKPID